MSAKRAVHAITPFELLNQIQYSRREAVTYPKRTFKTTTNGVISPVNH
jgi:hypothetical protein